MTDLLTPEDTGEIDLAETRVIFHQTADTAVIDLDDDHTRRMPSYLAVAPISPIPRRHTDEHVALEIPDTIGIYPPPAPRPTRHALTGRVAEHPVVRPTLPPHLARRRAAERRDRRARAASVLLLGVLAAAVLLLAVAW